MYMYVCYVRYVHTYEGIYVCMIILHYLLTGVYVGLVCMYDTYLETVIFVELI